MKKRILLMTMWVMLAVAVTGCGSENPDGVVTISAEDIGTDKTGESMAATESKQTELVQASEEAEGEQAESADVSAENEAQEGVVLSFADLSKLQFEFSSGAGAWSENFTIEKDGYFTGNFHDSDMGDTGEGYENGTFYSSSYTGHFKDLIQINDHTYQMKLADISYKETAGTSEIIDNVRYVYTKSYCLDGTDTYTIYLPGTPLAELSEEVRIWLLMMNESETELTRLAIVDEVNGYGIYSYDRPDPLEDAQMTFNSYKESYDYYSDKLTTAVTTAEMVEHTGTMCELSDNCLNYIWNLVRYHVDEDQFDEILAQQRNWIAEKEAEAKKAGSEYEGGSLSAVSYNEMLARLTMERCEELIEYLK